MSKQPHLMSRNGHYYFRYPVPVFLQKRIACKEFTYSLKTKDYHAAKNACWYMLRMVKVITTELEQQSHLTPAEAKKLAQTYFKQCLHRLQFQFKAAEIHSIEVATKGAAGLHSTHDNKDAYLADPIRTARRKDYLVPQMIEQLGQFIPIGRDNTIDTVNMDEVISYCLKHFGLGNVLAGTLSHEAFKKAITRAVAELSNVQAQMLEHEADITIKDSWFKDLDTPISAPTAASTLITEGNTIGGRISEFKAERMRGQEWTARTLKDREAQLALLAEILGSDTSVSAVDASKASHVKLTLQELPKHRNKNPKTRGLPLQQAIKVDVPKLDIRTVNEYLTTYQSFFGWAEIQGFITRNPFKKLAIRQKKSKQQKKDAFSLAQVKSILLELDKLKNSKTKAHLYWGTLIAIYSGARLNEIAQLTLDDVKETGGVLYFDINDEGDDEGGKRLKTESSKRKVPVHSKLLEMGFEGYLREARAGKFKKLFPALKFQNNHGHGRNLARWVNKNLLVDLKIKDKKLSFHSFRHTVVTTLYASQVAVEIVQELVGHSKNSITLNVYNHGYDLKRLQAELNKLVY